MDKDNKKNDTLFINERIFVSKQIYKQIVALSMSKTYKLYKNSLIGQFI